MGENTFYTKGDKDSIMKRIDQVHTVTMYCPLQYECIGALKDTLGMILNGYRTEENKWERVPAIDALRTFMIVKAMGKCGDFDAVAIIASSLMLFIKLKYITFEFTDSPEIYDTFNNILTTNSHELKNNIYRIDKLEFNLSDMFSQEIMDHFNKVLILNEIIPNDYLKRLFEIDFTYDEYVSFMDMFLGNYGPALNQKDNNICDYFRTFPPLIEEQKPVIKVITNYSDL